MKSLAVVSSLPLLMALSGCATSPALPAIYRAVHIDTLAPDKVGQFEEARKEWVDVLKKVDAHDGRGLFLKVGTHRYYTIRAFARFSDFDTRRDAIKRSLARVPKEAQERYDRLSDEALVFPHKSEIWRLDEELSTRFTESEAEVGRMVIEDVRPDPLSEAAYSEAARDINAALLEAHYPLSRLTFRTQFGAGHQITLWLARSRKDLEAAPAIETLLTRVRGEKRAAELLATLDATVEHRETHTFTVRSDLTHLQ